MQMAGHHDPRQQLVSHSVEISERFDNLHGKLLVLQVADHWRLVKPFVNSCKRLFLLPQFPFRKRQALRRRLVIKAFAISLDFKETLAWNTVRKACCDEVGRARLVPVRELATRDFLFHSEALCGSHVGYVSTCHRGIRL